jgi:hypothetical protein
MLVLSPSPVAIAVGIRKFVVSPSRRSDLSLTCALQEIGCSVVGLFGSAFGGIYV